MASVEILRDLEARSDGLALSRRLDTLAPRSVRIDLGASSVGRAMLALPVIDAVRRRFPDARLELSGRARVCALIGEHLGRRLERAAGAPDLIVDVCPAARRAASFDEAARRLKVPACPYPWRSQHASAHFADGATCSGLGAADVAPELRLSSATRRAGVRWVKAEFGLGRPLVVVLWRARGWGRARLFGVARELADRMRGVVIDARERRAPITVRAAVLGLSAVCVGDSGGLAHLAAATGAPVVTVHGRACPLRHGPATPAGVAVFASCREPVAHRASEARGARCLECLKSDCVLEVAERLAAEHWPRDWLRKVMT